MPGPPLLEPGARVDSFKVVQRLGAGGMGQVYLALDERDGRDVAIKILPKDEPDLPVLYRHFTHEERIYRTIHHPNVVAFIAAGETERFHYLVLEHILGVSLRTRNQREGPAGLVTCFSWMEELTLALHAAHQRDILHRDLKPDNVMITRELEVKLIDFGIAVLGSGTAQPESWVGTLAYSAPEYIGRRSQGPASDVFALGLVFYEMVTGETFVRDPFSPEGVQAEFRALDDRGWVLPDRDADELRREMDGLLYDMLRYEPGLRLPTTGAVLERLEGIADGVGGAVLLLSRDENKRVAQQETADQHLWNALALVAEPRVEEAVAELGRAGLFARALEPLARRMLVRQLDILLLRLGVAGADGSGFDLSPDAWCRAVEAILDAGSRILRPDDQELRCWIAARRAADLLDFNRSERFLRRRSHGRGGSPVVGAAYVGLLARESPVLAREPWNALVTDLHGRARLREATHQVCELERILGRDALSETVIQAHGTLLAAFERDQAEILATADDHETRGDLEPQVFALQKFLSRQPQSVKVLERLRRALGRLGRLDEARRTLVRAAAVHFLAGALGDAATLFTTALRTDPQDEEAALYLYTILMARGEVPPTAPADYRALQENVYRAFGVEVGGLS